MAGTIVVGEIQTESNGDLTLNPNGTGDVLVNDTNIATTSNKDINLAPHGTGVVEIHGNEEGGADNVGKLKLNCEQNSHGVTIQSPTHSATATYTLTLPTGAGTANQVLDIASVSNNVAQLGWADLPAAGASVSAENSWTAGQRAQVTAITSSSGVLAINFDASNNFLCITSENITDINYTDLNQGMVGQTGSIFIQYGGNHVVNGWDTETRWVGGTGGTDKQPTLTATNGQCDRIDYIIVADRDNPSQRSHVRVQMVATLNYAD